MHILPPSSTVRATILNHPVLLLVLLMAGCAIQPPVTQTGFLSDYSRLEAQSGSRMVYQSPQTWRYATWIIDPVELKLDLGKLSSEERAEVARYFNDALQQSIADLGIARIDTPGTDVARLRTAITDVAESTWWAKLHPASRAAGAGTGGAAMEAELVDSVSGEQLGAIIQAATGNQLDVTAFSTVADIKGAIDRWAVRFKDNVRDFRDR